MACQLRLGRVRPRRLSTLANATTHESVVSSSPNLLALRRVQGLLKQPQRRVLLLSATADNAVRSRLERDASAFELERCGHGLLGVREFCRLLLSESGERRVLGRPQLAALLLHHEDALPSASRFAAVSTLQRRKRVNDLLQLFWLLEREGLTAEQYAAAAEDSEVGRELVGSYTVYRELLERHRATSWDGLVMDVMELCGVQSGGGDARAREFSRGVMQQYTDVVVDNVHRMTPAMAKLVGHFCAQPSVLSSASFSRVLLAGDDCPRTQILERQLEETARDIGRGCTVTRTMSWEGDDVERAKARAFAQQLLVSGGASTKVARADVSPSMPFKCWRFGTSDAEEQGVAAFLADRLKSENTIVTVLCPSLAEANRLIVAFRKQGLPIQVDRDQLATLNTIGSPVHLFDEPGVNAVYSLLCALCFPSDSRHLYNVLRSDFFGFPAELLSWLMEKEHLSNADFFQVIEEFVDSKGKNLFTTLEDKENEHRAAPPAVSRQVESGLEIAESFVALLNRLRAECHQLSAAELVQLFLEETGRLDKLMSPDTPEQERESLALADFLRELETAQSVVGSSQVTFVAPYLLQLRDTNLSSSASWEQSSLDVAPRYSKTEEPRVRVLPLTSHALESLVSLRDTEDEGYKHILVLMSMRDGKFPGRMKRLTLPLPFDAMSEPFPVQTRPEHLAQCEQLAYEALTLNTYDEVVLSFAELAATKREVLSRTFLPIWHEGDKPPTKSTGSGQTQGQEPGKVASSPQHQTNSQASGAYPKAPPNTKHFWFSDLADLVRSFVEDVILPMWHHEKPLANVAEANEGQRKTQGVTQVAGQGTLKLATRKAAPLPAKSAERFSYEPSHLSYSQISEYLRCPHRYFLGRVMKLNNDVSTSMMFGRALHEGVAAFAKSVAAAQREGIDNEQVRKLSRAEAEEAFMRAWVGDGFGLFSSKEQAEFLLDRGMLALWDFINTHYDDLQLEEIVHVEKEFAFHVPKANVELRGVWDRIDRVDCGDGSSSFVIKEFKSNMGGAQRNMRKLADESLQLKMYMYAFSHVFGEAPHGAKLQQIGGSPLPTNADLSKATIRRTSVNEALVLFSEQAAQEAEAAITEVATGLRRGEFAPKPSFAECAFCPYAGSACHFATDSAAHEARSTAKATA